ncbi:NlpC/P60 family protein [Streptomyces sp. NPDC090025]|uniref:C40 family peptidase n=1 Tax=Streptomyces sp. NPDC090025 TaxID=3365922 RepID=UPI003833E7CC
MPGRLLRTVRTGALAGILLAATALGAPGPATGAPAAPAAPADPTDSVGSLLTRLRTLYQETERATEAYNAADEELKRQSAETRRTDDALARTRQALAKGRDEAGRLARSQYRGSGDELSPYLGLLLAADPQRALDGRRVLDRAARERAALVTRLRDAERKAKTLADASRTALDRRRELLGGRQKHKDTAQAKLREVERLLASLSADQLARLAALERTQTAGAQSELLGSGVLDGPRTPSDAGAEALRFAVRQIGKPYEWGAEGPDRYDCSGLTQRAWAAAGQEIPRTSEEQWARLRRIPLAELRPGDLVVYFPEATHVALYLGEGLVIHAPRPGARIKVSPIAANPLLGALRPDPEAPPAASFTPPELPAGATEGGDEGYAGTGGGAGGEAGPGGEAADPR